MNKKGVTWSTVIYSIIAIIVLITIVWLFRTQITEVYKSLTNIIGLTTSESEEVGNSLRELLQK